MIIRAETTLTAAMALLIAAHPDEATAAFRAAGADLPDVIDPGTIATEVETTRGDKRGRLDINAHAGVPVVIEGKLGADLDPVQVADYAAAAGRGAVVINAMPAVFTETAHKLFRAANLDRVVVISWEALLEALPNPVAGVIARDLAAIAATDSRVAQRGELTLALGEADLGAAMPYVTSTMKGYPSIDLYSSDHDYAYGQIQREDSGQFVGTVGVWTNARDFEEPERSVLVGVLRGAERALDDAGLGAVYRRWRGVKEVHRLLDMRDKPWLARGFDPKNGGYLGVKVPGDTLVDAINKSIRALSVYGRLCRDAWPDGAIAPGGDGR